MGTTASVINPRNIHSTNNCNCNTIGTSTSTTEVRQGMLLPNQLKSDWKLAADLVKDMEKGDLIEIRRKSYTHWVVFIGFIGDVHCVIHISTDAVESPSKKEMRTKLLKICAAKVRSDPFLVVAASDMCRINNCLDAKRRPFPPSIIAERAINKLGTGGYHLIRNNCEHFAKWCRYNLRESDQSMIGQASALGIASFFATTSLHYGLVTGVSSFVIMKAGQAWNRSVMRSII